VKIRLCYPFRSGTFTQLSILHINHLKPNTMAKLPQGIFGPITGKVGNIVGATCNGIAYIRSIPEKSDKPKTQAQINNMARFKFFNEELNPFHQFITIGLQNKAIGMTPMNVASSINHKEFVTGVFPNFEVHFSKLIWSEGMLPQLNGARVSLTGPDTLILSWLQNNQPQAAFDDQVLLLVYCPELKIADGFIGGTIRADEQCTFKLNPRFIGYALEIYVSATSLNRKKIANSAYLGKLEPQHGNS
jgi:hypothetical protein